MRTLLCRHNNGKRLEEREEEEEYKKRKSSMWLFDFEIKIGKVCIGILCASLLCGVCFTVIVIAKAAKMIYLFFVANNEKSIGFGEILIFY